MTDTPHILCAFEFDGKGGATALEGKAITKKINDNALAWVHFDVTHKDTREWITTEVPYLDPLVIDALLARESRPRVTEYPEGMLVILRGVNLNENESEEDMVSIRLWIDAHRIISTRIRKLKAVQNIRDRLAAGTGPKKSADFLIMLVNNLLTNMEPVIIALDDQTDQIEEELLDNPDFECRKNINEIRRKCIMLRRYISPQKEAIGHIRNADVPWINERHRRQMQEGWDKSMRFTEDLDSIRDRGQIIKDELTSILSDRMNKNLYVLSLIAALFLPLGFLTGLLGINVGGMPGVESGAAFWIVCIICAGVLVGEYFLFRFLRWL